MLHAQVSREVDGGLASLVRMRHSIRDDDRLVLRVRSITRAAKTLVPDRLQKKGSVCFTSKDLERAVSFPMPLQFMTSRATAPIHFSRHLCTK